ncbi:PRP46 [[Candida] subhashii]|uniref:Pre-mRNA-splicing factor PRP46 n=1 Tax=[Candida] subhashii TaxID=561895 RepID=A0A8J5QMC7_9ASCO|nr:PRP46 [[Candida] subhashii]KAG7662947.1 PRP46 [[Candida] subhashii]
MTSYEDIPIPYKDDDIIPEEDTMAEAMYNNVKLDHILKNINHDNSINNYQSEEEEDEVEQEDTLPPSGQVATTSQSNNNNWKLIRTLAGAHQGWVRSIAIDEITNQWYVTGSSDSTIKIWDLASSQLKATLTGHIMGVRSLVISKRFPYLFSGSEDKTIRCWDLERTNAIEGCQIRNYHGHVGGIYAMSLHPELNILFTGGRDSVIRVWDIRSRNEIMTLVGHSNDISSIESQLIDPQVISSSMDGTIRLWDLRKQNTQVCLTHHIKSIRDMKLHPQELTFCSGDSNGNIKQWLLPKGQLLNEFEKPPQDGRSKIINTLSINHVSNTLFAGYDDGKMEFYDYINGDLIQSGTTPPVQGSTESAIYASTFDVSGLRLITCEGDKSIKIWGNTNA